MIEKLNKMYLLSDEILEELDSKELKILSGIMLVVKDSVLKVMQAVVQLNAKQCQSKSE